MKVFDEKIYPYRDAVYLFKISCIAEEAQVQKRKGKELTELQSKFVKECHQNLIYPYRNQYIESYMGVISPGMNSIYNVPRDILHTVDSGVVKSCLLYCLVTIKSIQTYSKGYTKVYRQLSQTIDGRIRFF